jgi:nucleoside-diphosphate kinase
MAAKERTFAIIKPDAVRKGVIGPILDMAYRANLIPHKMVMADPLPHFWRGFYAEHEGKPFYGALVEFMCSGPSVFLLLEGPDAIVRWRELMGATNPEKAQAHTIRGKFGTAGPANAVHGSDSIESARREALLFKHHAAVPFIYSDSDPLGEAALCD